MRLLLLKPSIPIQFDEYDALFVRLTAGTVHCPVIAVKPEPVIAYPDQLLEVQPAAVVPCAAPEDGIRGECHTDARACGDPATDSAAAINTTIARTLRRFTAGHLHAALESLVTLSGGRNAGNAFRQTATTRDRRRLP